MAQIATFDPAAIEARSALIAGIIEALNKISIILDMKTTSYEQMKLSAIYIDNKEKNKNRIYQSETGKRLWLSTPNPIIRKNGNVINPINDFFEIDLIGGSITFDYDYRLIDSDVVTATVTTVNSESTILYNIINDITVLKTAASHDKGYYATIEALLIAYPVGVVGDMAIIGSTDTIWLWDDATQKWADSHQVTDLTDYYTKLAIDNLLGTKEPTLNAKGETILDDNYYFGGRKQWIDLFYKVRNTVLNGLDTTNTGVITELDNIISALGKIQNQITANKLSITQETADRKANINESITNHNMSVFAHEDIRSIVNLASTFLVKRVFGNIGTSVDYQFDFFANVNGLRYPNGLWEIKFFGRIDENTAPNDFSNFRQGLSVLYIKTMLGIISNLQYLHGGMAKIYTNSMQVIRAFSDETDCFQYGYVVQYSYNSDNLLFIGRYYTSSGDDGAWSSGIQDLYKRGNYIEGSLYMQEVE